MAKVKIENKIVGYRVSTEEKSQVNEAPEQNNTGRTKRCPNA